MRSKPASIVRLFLVLALALATLPVLPFDDCGTPRECGCCPAPEMGCCSAVENEKPAPNVPVPGAQSHQALRDALTPQRPVLLILPAVTDVSFPLAPWEWRGASAGHSRQSILCVRLV